MGQKSRDEYIKELKRLDKNMKVTDDHNVDDIRNMIELATLRNEKAGLLKEKETLTKALEAERNSNAAIVKSNKELQQRLEEASDTPAAGNKLPGFTHEKQKYRFVAPTFELNGQRYDVREGTKGVPAEVLARLVEIRSGVIQKVEK